MSTFTDQVAVALEAPIPGHPDPAHFANEAADYFDALPERIVGALEAAEKEYMNRMLYPTTVQACVAARAAFLSALQKGDEK